MPPELMVSVSILAAFQIIAVAGAITVASCVKILFELSHLANGTAQGPKLARIIFVRMIATGIATGPCGIEKT